MLRRITRDDLRNHPELSKKGKSLNQMHDFGDEDNPTPVAGKKKAVPKKAATKKAAVPPAKKAAPKKTAKAPVKKTAPTKAAGKASGNRAGLKAGGRK